MTFKVGNKFGCKKCSEETKRKISFANSGNKNGNYGGISEESKLKISKSLSGKYVGEKSKSWKGGKNKINKCLNCGKIKNDYILRKFCSKLCSANYPPRKEKHSKFMKGRIGELGGNWQGGKFYQGNLRSYAKYISWRNKVYEIFGKKCECGETENLEVDHIKPLSIIMAEEKVKSSIDFLNNEKVWDIKNGRVLCKKCHRNKQNSWKNLKKIKMLGTVS